MISRIEYNYTSFPLGSPNYVTEDYKLWTLGILVRTISHSELKKLMLLIHFSKLKI